MREVPDASRIKLALDDGPLSARELIAALVDQGFGNREARRGLQRELDRGSIRLGSSLRIELLNEGIEE